MLVRACICMVENDQKQYFFTDFLMFLIVFDHANACTSSRNTQHLAQITELLGLHLGSSTQTCFCILWAVPYGLPLMGGPFYWAGLHVLFALHMHAGEMFVIRQA